MGEKNDLWKKAYMATIPIKCEKCGGKIYYLDSGRYQCKDCDAIMYDAYGKVKKYLEENGPAPNIVISKMTGVDVEIIDQLLKDGQVQIPEGSKFYISCERCGCNLRYGRFCVDCYEKITNGLTSAFDKRIGERPRSDRQGKMHYLRGLQL